MTLLVTGGTGFIGSRLVAALRRGGDPVRCLVRPTSRTGVVEAAGAECVVGSLETGEGLDIALRGVRAVLHLAGVVRAWSSEEYFRVNVSGTQRLVERARKAGVERFVLVSSLAAAGPSRGADLRKESDEPSPVGPYGESKLAAERTLAACAGTMRWSIVRPCIVYGPGDRDVFQLFRLVRWRVVPFTATRGATVSVVHVDDVVALSRLCLERAPSGSLYHISDGKPVSWPGIVGAIARAMEVSPIAIRIPPALLWPVAASIELTRPLRARPPLLCLQKLREARQDSWVCSPERAWLELGFEPGISLEDGARSTALWYRENRWL